MSKRKSRTKLLERSTGRKPNKLLGLRPEETPLGGRKGKISGLGLDFFIFFAFLLSFGAYLNYLFYDLDKPTTPLVFGQKTLHKPTTTITPTLKSHPCESKPVPNPPTSSANGLPSTKGHLQQGKHKHCPIPTEPKRSCF